MKRKLFTLKMFMLLVLMLMTGNMTYAQTYLYKRVNIVKKMQKVVKNDDAHYITFNDKGCYESDANGYALSNRFIEFKKTENNILCYYGRGVYGFAWYYFSSDYSRLNINLGDVIYVYQHEKSGRTTAQVRRTESNNNSGSSHMIIMPPVSNTNSSTIHSEPYRRNVESCTQCYGTGNCSVCNGSRWMDLYYTGDRKPCTICNATGKCRSCNGSGKK